jgi:hypothetical protein
MPVCACVCAWQDYTFYAASVVNNPHSGWAVHQYVGAFPHVTFHYPRLSPASPPFVNTSLVRARCASRC